MAFPSAGEYRFTPHLDAEYECACECECEYMCVSDKYAPQEQLPSLAVKKTRPQEALPIYFATVLWITGNNTFQKDIFIEYRYRKSY